MNLDLWNELSDEHKAAVKKAAAEFEAKRFAVAEREQVIWENKMREAGVHVYDLTPEQQNAFGKKLREYVWPKLKKEVGEEFFTKVEKAVADSLK